MTRAYPCLLPKFQFQFLYLGFFEESHQLEPNVAFHLSVKSTNDETDLNDRARPNE
jgi:hypothetical protein